jgi:transcriptional regulator with XRE-family HTH domain/predicted nucleotidyltransferase
MKEACMIRRKSNFDVFLEKQMENPAFSERIRKAGEAWDVALQLAALRREAGLSQKELAGRVGTSQQQISRLESPSYEGHSLSMIRRVAAALGARIHVQVRREGPLPADSVAEREAVYGNRKTTKDKRVTSPEVPREGTQARVGGPRSAGGREGIEGVLSVDDIRKGVANSLSDPPKPLKVILFGSYALGTPRKDSDIDIVVILDKEGKSDSYAAMIQNRMEVYRRLRQMRARYPMDVLVYTKDEWEELRASGSSFIRGIERDGVSIL